MKQSNEAAHCSSYMPRQHQQVGSGAKMTHMYESGLFYWMLTWIVGHTWMLLMKAEPEQLYDTSSPLIDSRAL